MTMKEWITPTLTVITRTRPEESVLSACKGGWQDGPRGGFGLCHTLYVYPGCGACSVKSES
jgi:hypothetical protein